MERIKYTELPEGFINGMMTTESYLNESSLEKQLIELIKLRASQINECAYCIDMHHKDAIHLGETEQRLHLLGSWKESQMFSEKEESALAFAETLTRSLNHNEIDNAFKTLSAHFSKNEIADIVLVISQINSWNRISKSFGSVAGSYKIGQFD